MSIRILFLFARIDSNAKSGGTARNVQAHYPMARWNPDDHSDNSSGKARRRLYKTDVVSVHLDALKTLIKCYRDCLSLIDAALLLITAKSKRANVTAIAVIKEYKNKNADI